ncbi:peptidase S9 [Saccharibacillus sp. O23]|nr:peptidase S9 [Saccharibacillus sp. O23]
MERHKAQGTDARAAAAQRPKVQDVNAQIAASQQPKVQETDAWVAAAQRPKAQDADAQVAASQRPKVQDADARAAAAQRPKAQDVSSGARELDRASDSEAPGSYPVLVYCRGGIGRVGRVRLDWLAEFAAFGRIVMAPCYRGGESGVGHDEFGGADLEDSRIAVRLARAIPGADPARIAVLGFSRGSINATDAAIEEHASRLVLWGGLSDLAVTYEERIDLRRMLKRVVKGSAYKLPDVYLERSPIHMAKRLNCPVLIMHGTEDAQVDYGHGERMYAELRRLGKSAALTSLEGLGHHMPQETRMRVLAGMFAWLEAPPNP